MEAVGFNFSNHDLWRAGGRPMFEARAGPLAISKILGHKDLKTTIKYLG